MSKLKFYKQTAAPSAGNWEANSVYFVSKTIGTKSAAEMFVTDQAGNPREVSTEQLVQEIIDGLKGQNGGLASLDSGGKVPVAQLPSGIGLEFVIVPDIASRNALSLTQNSLVLVLDASGDATVTAGNALYAYEVATTTYHKLSEFESLDLTGLMSKFRVRANTGAAFDVFDNELITFQEGGNITITRSGSTFTFSVSGGAAHSHTNKVVLDKLSEDANGDLNYDGTPVVKWTTNQW